MISWVVVGRPSAEKILKMVPKDEQPPTPALFNYFDDSGTESPYIVSTFLFDFRRRMLENGIDPILPIVEVNEEESQFEVNKSLVVSNTGTPYELSSLNTLNFNLLANNVSVADLVINEEGHYIIAKIDNIDSKLKLEVLTGNQIRLHIDLSLYGYISESKHHLRSEELPHYSKLLEDEGKKEITAFLKEIISKGYDPLGFSLKYRSTTLHNKRMSAGEWQKAYKSAEINLTINAELKSTGTIR